MEGKLFNYLQQYSADKMEYMYSIPDLPDPVLASSTSAPQPVNPPHQVAVQPLLYDNMLTEILEDIGIHEMSPPVTSQASTDLSSLKEDLKLLKSDMETHKRASTDLSSLQEDMKLLKSDMETHKKCVSEMSSLFLQMQRTQTNILASLETNNKNLETNNKNLQKMKSRKKKEGRDKGERPIKEIRIPIYVTDMTPSITIRTRTNTTDNGNPERSKAV